MPGDSNLVTVRFGADASGIRKGAAEASQHVDGLVGKLKEFKQEQVSQSRTARFFASQIAEIIPVSDSAKGALQGLLAVGLSGGGLAFAFEGAVFVLKQLKDHFEENEKAAAKLKEVSDKLSDSLAKIRDSFGPPKTATQKAWLEWLRPLHKEMDELQQKIDDIMEAGRLVPEIGASAQAAAGPAIGKKTAIAQTIAGQTPEVDSTDAEERRDQARKQEAEDVKKLQEESRRDLIKSIDDNLAEYERELRAIEQIRDQEAAEDKKLHDRSTHDLLKSIDDQLAAEEQEMRAIAGMHDSVTEQTEKKWKKVADAIGSAMAQTVSSIIKGTESIGDAFANLAQRLLDMALESIFKGIFGALFGPAGGVLGGLLGSLLPFETGGDIPTAASGLDLPKIGGAIPILAHAGEAVVTRSTTDRLGTFLDRVDRGELLSGDGEGPLHIHFHGVVNDAAGIEKLFRSHEARRAVSQMRRLGEWPG